MVQGQAYLAFVTLVLPEVFKDMETPRLAIAGAASVDTRSDNESDDEDHTDRQDKLDIVATQTMQQAFHRMELEVVNVRTSLGAKVDAALVNLTNNRSSLDTKLDTLEGLMKDNLKQNNELVKAITDLSLTIKNTSTNINIEPSHLDKIAESVTSHPSLTNLSTTLSSLRSEVAQSSNMCAVQSEVQGLATSLNNLETQVNNISKTINDTNEAATKDMAQMRKNSDRSLDLFDAMKQSLDVLAKQASNAESSTLSNPTTHTQNPPPTIVNATEDKTYKGIMFASNSALDIDTKKIKNDLNCDLKIISTEHILPHIDSSNPDSHLQGMVNQHLAGKGCYDFAIIATGMNDITDLDIGNAPPTTLTSNVADQTKKIVEVAENLVTENNIDVFIVDKTPRYDPDEKDPTSLYAKLTKYSNGVLASSVGMTPRLFIVDQSNLARSGTKARSDIFRSDGLLLTDKGLSFYTNSITKSLTDCYPDMAASRQTNPPTQARDHGQGAGRNGGGARAGQGQGRRSDHRDGRDRQHQDRPGYGYPGSLPYPYHNYPPPPPPGWDRGGWGGPRQQRPRGRDSWNDSERYMGYSGRYNGGYRRH